MVFKITPNGGLKVVFVGEDGLGELACWAEQQLMLADMVKKFWLDRDANRSISVRDLASMTGALNAVAIRARDAEDGVRGRFGWRVELDVVTVREVTTPRGRGVVRVMGFEGESVRRYMGMWFELVGMMHSASVEDVFPGFRGVWRRTGRLLGREAMMGLWEANNTLAKWWRNRGEHECSDGIEMLKWMYSLDGLFTVREVLRAWTGEVLGVMAPEEIRKRMVEVVGMLRRGLMGGRNMAKVEVVLAEIGGLV